ncbi:hypothetical protein SO802_003063 [Lithocarpus litseifolius]|uniref:protein-serine/threonine phosphatase n=1 Tax=Lithocarpus litseifolius TaxID=425828 RepID=A0AAW2E0R6_9ROSI
MDGFIHKRRKREPKAKNGVVKLNSELFSGSISVIGRQRVMEDAVKVVHEFVSVAGNPYDFFGVYDGHGGARVASACKERMHALLEKEVVEEGGGVVVEWEKVMRSCFWKMDEEVRTGGGGVKVEMVGSTAVVVVVGKEDVVVANCGDSRAVLCRGGAAVPLSRDHKPDRADEMERVEAAGGRILNWNGSRVLGVLATSRSIGDHYLRPYVISEPEVTVTERTELDDFLVIASDGLWDVVSNEFACEVVRRCLDGQIKRRISEVSSESTAGDAAAILAELAMSRGSNDNISVIVVELKK